MPEGTSETSAPEPGEVIWADRIGVTCRRWNWRQGRRTRLGETTTNAYFVLDRLAPYSIDALDAAGRDLIARLAGVSPAATFETDLLGAER